MLDYRISGCFVWLPLAAPGIAIIFRESWIHDNNNVCAGNQFKFNSNSYVRCNRIGQLLNNRHVTFKRRSSHHTLCTVDSERQKAKEKSIEFFNSVRLCVDCGTDRAHVAKKSRSSAYLFVLAIGGCERCCLQWMVCLCAQVCRVCATTGRRLPSSVRRMLLMATVKLSAHIQWERALTSHIPSQSERRKSN